MLAVVYVIALVLKRMSVTLIIQIVLLVIINIIGVPRK